MSTQDPSDLNKQGYQFSRQGNYQAAISCYTQGAELARRDGQHIIELRSLGSTVVCWLNLGEYDKAADSAAHLLTRAKLFNNQESQIQAGKWLAIAIANIDLRTRWPEIHQVLVDGLRAARELGNNYEITYHLMRLGSYAQQIDEVAMAYEWLQEALNVLTSTAIDEPFASLCYSQIYQVLSKLTMDQGDHVNALRYAELALASGQKYGRPDEIIEGQCHLARIHAWRKEQSDALSLLELALVSSRRLNNEYLLVTCLVLYVELLTDLRLTERAQAVYDELWATEWQSPDRYKDIGPVAYKQMRDLPGAERAFRRFLEGRPTHPDGHSKLALVLFDQGRVSEAVREWRAALTHRERHPNALAGLALGLWALGEREEAGTIFGQAVSLQPQVVEPTYLDEEFGWSTQVVEAIRPLILVYNSNAQASNFGANS